MLMVRGSPNPKHLGLPSRLRKARKQAALTRMALAEKAGVGTPTVLYIETGARLPEVGTIARLAAALDLSAAWLAYGIGEQSSGGQSPDCAGMGARLLFARTQQGHTKASLARLASLNPGSIAGIERGRQAGAETVEAIAKALRIAPGWLAYGIGERELPPRRRRSTVA